MAEQTTRASGFKYHSPKDIHLNNIIQIGHIYVFSNMYVYTNMYIATILKEIPNLKKGKKRNTERFVESKRSG